MYQLSCCNRKPTWEQGEAATPSRIASQGALVLRSPCLYPLKPQRILLNSPTKLEFFSMFLAEKTESRGLTCKHHQCEAARLRFKPRGSKDPWLSIPAFPHPTPERVFEGPRAIQKLIQPWVRSHSELSFLGTEQRPFLFWEPNSLQGSWLTFVQPLRKMQNTLCFKYFCISKTFVQHLKVDFFFFYNGAKSCCTLKNKDVCAVLRYRKYCK